jgi:hypothetical protein
MARTPYATVTYDTSQKGPRVPDGPVSYIVIHHAATISFQAVIDLENGAREVSSTVIIKDGQVASMFDETNRAWSLSSQYWDSVSLSSETCNETTAPGWTISEASYGTLAKVVADWCRRYSIPCDRDHIMGHREFYTRYGASYATACPGGIDLDRVVRDATAVLAGTTPAAPSQDQGDVPMRYIHSANGRFGLVLEHDFQQYTEGGRWGKTYIESATAASKLFGGIDVDDRTYDIARQDALNRKADYMGEMAALSSGVDPTVLTEIVRKAIDDGLTEGGSETPDVAAIVRTELSKLVLKAQ